VGPRAIQGPLENRKISYACWELNYDFSAVQVTILTELSWLQIDIHKRSGLSSSPFYLQLKAGVMQKP
jgi:hypothetical protein